MSYNSARLDGKTALITNSSSGSGRDAAVELARRGADVVINFAQDSSSAQQTVNEINSLGRRAIAVQGDMAKPDDVRVMFLKTMEYYGKLDIVVSNSGADSFKHISEISVPEFDRVFNTNARGQLLVAQQAYKHLSVGGQLVMLTNGAAAKGVKNTSLYSGSNAAVESFAQSLAADMADKRINVTAIAPGGVQTVEGTKKVEQVTSRWSARAVAFAASEECGWTNGQTLTV